MLQCVMINICTSLCPDGGWTVIQRRHDGSVNFDQLWKAYEKGFGSLNGKCSLKIDAILTIYCSLSVLEQINLKLVRHEQKSQQKQDT